MPEKQTVRRTTQDMEPMVLKVNEAAKLLSVSTNYLYELIAQNQIPGVIRVGRCLRISKKSILEWIGDAEQSKELKDA